MPIPRRELMVRLGRLRNRLTWALQTVRAKGNLPQTEQTRRDIREELEFINEMESLVRAHATDDGTTAT